MKEHRFAGDGPFPPSKAGYWGCVDCGAWTTYCLSAQEAREKMGPCKPDAAQVLESEWSQGTNPRVLLWLIDAEQPFDLIARRSGEDIPLVAEGDQKYPWTVLFVDWIQQRWREWALSLGFKGSLPHRKALLGGHTDNEFDAWLVDRVRGES